MFECNTVRTPIAGAVLVVAASGAFIPQGVAQELTVPSQAMSDYLISLVNADIERLLAFIGRHKRQKNQYLTVKPANYSEFLRDHYAGVPTTVEANAPDGDSLRAQVSFDRPDSDPTSFYFILNEVNGQWRISN